MFPENVTLVLTPTTFGNPESYDSLQNIDPQQGRDIQTFFDYGYPNEFKIKVSNRKSLASVLYVLEQCYVIFLHFVEQKDSSELELLSIIF